MRRLWQNLPLRLRLSVWYAGGGFVLLALFCATLYLYVERRMARPLDERLRQDFRVLQQNLSWRAEEGPCWEGSPVDEARARLPKEIWFEIWAPDGSLQFRSWSLDERRLDRLPFSPAPGQETLSVFGVAPELRLRVLSAPYPTSPEPGWMLRVMRIHEPASEALGALVWIMIVALPVVLALLVAVGYLMARDWIKPLQLMVAEAEQIGPTNLSQRLTVVRPEDELGRMARVFNQSLDRVEASFAALENFAADASHELRTPLATLRGVGETALQSGRSTEEVREAIVSMLEEARRLEKLTEQLLRLARAASGPGSLQIRSVRLDSLVATCVEDLRVLAEEKQQTLVYAAAVVEVNTDPVPLRQALLNVIENAIKYSPAGSSIEVALLSVGEEWWVDVSDQGPGVPDGLVEHLTQRFTRGAFRRGPQGFGLGLALTSAYLKQLGGRLECRARQPRGSVFSLILSGSSAARPSRKEG